jgi:hypothetical protein
MQPGRPKFVWRPAEIPGELVHRMNVGTYGVRRVVTTLKLIQHHLAKRVTGNLLVTHTLT